MDKIYRRSVTCRQYPPRSYCDSSSRWNNERRGSFWQLFQINLEPFVHLLKLVLVFYAVWRYGLANKLHKMWKTFLLNHHRLSQRQRLSIIEKFSPKRVPIQNMILLTVHRKFFWKSLDFVFKVPTISLSVSHSKAKNGIEENKTFMNMQCIGFFCLTCFCLGISLVILADKAQMWYISPSYAEQCRQECKLECWNALYVYLESMIVFVMNPLLMELFLIQMVSPDSP